MNGYSRQKPNKKLKGHNKAFDLAYNEAAGALKHAEVRPKILLPGVAINTAAGFDMGKLVALFNSDTVVHYYAKGGRADCAH